MLSGEIALKNRHYYYYYIETYLKNIYIYIYVMKKYHMVKLINVEYT